jgi:para-nitrobenzyl esterase
MTKRGGLANRAEAGALIHEPLVVETAHGKLRGSRVGDVLTVKGVPYADDTGGANRFMAPKPVKPWAGIRDALSFGPRCPQLPDIWTRPAFQWLNAAKEPFAEDCCTLNIFAPAGRTNSNRPVMVWIHGGGYYSGSGSRPATEGARLAARGDVVVVTLNHRIGILGYLNLADLGESRFDDAANAGQLDLIAALEWVRDNIAIFGGDPDNVTIFGHSAGGSKVMTLLAMPAARGLFHRAINMSGFSAFEIPPANATTGLLPELLDALEMHGREGGDLQQVPAERLVRAGASIAKRVRPVADGRHIPGGPLSGAALESHGTMPLIMGLTASEGTLWREDDDTIFRMGVEQAISWLSRELQLSMQGAEKFFSSYRQDMPGSSASRIAFAIENDLRYRRPMMDAAIRMAGAGKKVYSYLFAYSSPADGGIYGSPHTIDIPFIFGTTELARPLLGAGQGVRDLSDAMLDAWAAFARSGRPDCRSIPSWKPLDADGAGSIVLDLGEG